MEQVLKEDYVEVEDEERGVVERFSVSAMSDREYEQIVEADRGSISQSHGRSEQGDFLDEARKLVDGGKAKSMTEAMKKVRRRNPQLHEEFKNGSKPGRYPVTAQQFKSNEKFRALVEKYQLALDQAGNAARLGYQSIAQGVLKKTDQILVEMRQLLCEDKYRDLLEQRDKLSRELHEAIMSNPGDSKRLGEQLASIDNQIAAV